MLQGTGLRPPNSAGAPLPLWRSDFGLGSDPLQEEEVAAATATSSSSSSSSGGGRCSLCCAALGWGAVSGLLLLLIVVCFIVQFCVSAAGGEVYAYFSSCHGSARLSHHLLWILLSVQFLLLSLRLPAAAAAVAAPLGPHRLSSSSNSSSNTALSPSLEGHEVYGHIDGSATPSKPVSFGSCCCIHVLLLSSPTAAAAAAVASGISNGRRRHTIICWNSVWLCLHYLLYCLGFHAACLGLRTYGGIEGNVYSLQTCGHLQFNSFGADLPVSRSVVSSWGFVELFAGGATCLLCCRKFSLDPYRLRSYVSLLLSSRCFCRLRGLPLLLSLMQLAIVWQSAARFTLAWLTGFGTPMQLLGSLLLASCVLWVSSVLTHVLQVDALNPPFRPTLDLHSVWASLNLFVVWLCGFIFYVSVYGMRFFSYCCMHGAVWIVYSVLSLSKHKEIFPLQPIPDEPEVGAALVGDGVTSSPAGVFPTAAGAAAAAAAANRSRLMGGRGSRSRSRGGWLAPGFTVRVWKMCDMTFIARSSDGLLLAESWSPHCSSSGSSLEQQQQQQQQQAIKQQVKQVLQRLHGGPSQGAVDAGPRKLYYCLANGLSYLVVCSNSYPRKLAFCFLSEVKSLFEEELKAAFGSHSVDYFAMVETIETPYYFLKFDRVLQKKRLEFEDASSSRSLSRLNESLSEVSDIMRQNINDILQRGDNLSDVGRKASDLKSASETFKGLAKSLSFQALLRQYAPLAFVLVFFLILLIWKLWL
ncbi:hypothetical protein Efla_004708 [Eimeria flavescens]